MFIIWQVEEVDEVVQQQGAESESTAEESIDTAVFSTASELEHAAEDEKLNGYEGDVKVPGVPKNPVDTQATGLYLILLFINFVVASHITFTHTHCTVQYLWHFQSLVENLQKSVESYLSYSCIFRNLEMTSVY